VIFLKAYYAIFILLVAIIPLASAEVTKIGLGSDVFIGDTGIDITGCVGNASQLAWFTPGSNPATDPPHYVISVGDATNFSVAPAVFGGRTGSWYQWTGTGGATIVAFHVLDPSVDARDEGITVISTHIVTSTTNTSRVPGIVAPGDILPVTVPNVVPGQAHIVAPGDILLVTVPNIVPGQAQIVAPDDVLPVSVPGIGIVPVQPQIVAPGDILPVTLPGTVQQPMPGMEWPTGYGKFESSANARGIFYNGKLYVWSIWWSSDTYKQMTSKDMYRIQYRTFQNGQLSGPSQLWDGTTYAEPAPVIVQYANGTQKMFVFITGRNGNLYFTRLNGTVWEDGDWLKITDPATGGVPTTKEESWEIAPVYNPETHRIYVYYAKDYNDYLHYAYSDDYGNTWHAPGLVTNSPVIKYAPGAVFYKPTGGTTDVLLAMKDVDQKIRVCKLAGGTVVSSEVLPTPSSDTIYGYGRPFLTDVGNGYIALMYAAEHGDQTYCSDWYIPHIVLLNKATGQWGVPYQATTLPDLGVAQGEYQFHWQPNGVIDPTTNTFWLFYGFELCALYTDTTNNGPWWMFNPIPTPGA
jgi:hypothetical protein